MNEKQITFKVKAEETDGKLFIEGWAVKYGITDDSYFKDKLLYGCCTKTLSESKGKIKLLFEHDRGRVIGKMVSFEDSMEGLYIKAMISDAEPELKTKIKEGLYDSFSIGFYEIKANQVFQNDKLIENQISEIKLKEVSLVSFAAFKNAKFTITKSISDILESESEYATEEELKEKIKSLVDEPEHSREPNHSEPKPIDFTYIKTNFKLN